MKEKLKRIEEEKMKLELHVADVVHDHKIKRDAMLLKIRKIKSMPFILRLGIIMPLDQLLH